MKTSTARIVAPLVAALALAGAASAALTAEETVALPVAAAWGGGDTVGSALIGRTYAGGNGPGIWIVADGGYRLYLNGELLAQDNAAGRVTFVPMTFLPGTNAVSVVGVDGNGAPGVLVQIDELDTSYVSGSSWKVSSAVSDNSWKGRAYDASSWVSATASGAATTTPGGKALSGFASGSGAQWIWASSASSAQAVLRFTFSIQATGFGASTTGGDGGTLTIATDSASVRAALQDGVARTILIPEGTYDFRLFQNAATKAAASGYTWCKRKCGSSDANSSNMFYRINFYANSCKELDTTATIVTAADSLKMWGNWITTKPNKTLVGMGRGAALRGASIAMRTAEGAKNQIYRNLAFYDVNPHLIEGGDGLNVVGTSSSRTSNFWADHISYKWISDGMDMEYVTGATISWLDYDGRNDSNCYATDPYVALVEDAELTYANVYWHGTMGRVPKVASAANSSKVHVFNSYVDTNTYFVAGAKGASSSVTSQVLYENNYLDHVFYAFTLKETYGYVDWTGNTVANSTAKYFTNGTGGTTAPADAVFTPSYSYAKRTVSTLPTVIPKYAGMGGPWGSMPAYDQAFGRSNRAPSVRLVSPADGATATAPASLTLTAAVSDSDGTVKSVAFYAGTSLVGTATASPWSVAVTGVPAGTWSFVAVATDDDGLANVSVFATVTVAGTANTAPSITSSSTASVPENVDSGSVILTVAATDAEGDALAYLVSGGSDMDLFAMDSATGALAFRFVPDFEHPIDADSNGQYKVRVQVVDAQGLYAQQNLLINVTDVDESPVFSSGAAFAVEENSIAVGTVVAEDPDSNAVTYALAGGADSALFVLDAASGALAFRTAPDYEAPADAGGDNVYAVVVAASDGTLKTLQTVTVTVVDVSEGTTGLGGGASRVPVRVVWIGLDGSVLGSGTAWVDPERPRPAAPSSLRGVGFARLELQGGAVVVPVVAP